MSAPAAPAAPPRPPSVSEIFEQSLIAPVDPSVFRRAAARPAPSFGASAGVAAAAGAAALAVGLAHAIVANPGLLQSFSPAVLAAAGVAALGLYASLFLLLGVVLYGAGGALGGKGEFERGLQAAAMLSVLAPAQMLCNWFPAAWAVPALLAAWVAACALEGLFNARRAPALALSLVAALAAIGAEYAGRSFVDRYAAVAAVAANPVPDAELVRSVSALAQQAAVASNASLPAPAAPATATSGLDLLRGPSDNGGPVPANVPPSIPSVAPPPAGSASSALPTPNAADQAMQASAAGMLDALQPMLNMVTANPNLKPQQKADIKELQGMMLELKADMARTQRMDDAVFKAKMQRYQALLMRVMSYSNSAPAGAGAAKPRGAP